MTHNVNHEKSLGDTAARISRSDLKHEKARVLSRREPVTVAGGSPLSDGITAMQQAGSGVLLVVDGDRLAGIITESDLLHRVIGLDVDPSAPVDGFMTPDPTTLSVEDATVGDAMALMDSGRYRTVPLVDGDGRLAGIVHQREVIEYVAESFPQEILNLPPRPHQQMEAPEGA